MKVTFFGTAVTMSACLMFGPSPSAAGLGGQQRETEQIDRSFPFGPGGELNLKTFSGRVTITASNRANVVVHAVRRATADRLAGIHLDIQANPTRITIDANKKDESWGDRNDNVVETDFDIEVPEQTALDIHGFSSNIHVTGVHGHQKLHVFSGSIDLRDVSAPVEAETFSGDIGIELAPGAGGHLDINTFSGTLTSDAPLVTRTGGRRHMSGDIGSGGTTAFTLKTFSGDVHIK